MKSTRESSPLSLSLEISNHRKLSCCWLRMRLRVAPFYCVRASKLHCHRERTKKRAKNPFFSFTDNDFCSQPWQMNTFDIGGKMALFLLRVWKKHCVAWAARGRERERGVTLWKRTQLFRSYILINVLCVLSLSLAGLITLGVSCTSPHAHTKSVTFLALFERTLASIIHEHRPTFLSPFPSLSLSCVFRNVSVREPPPYFL
jgi:hypothetical protein